MPGNRERVSLYQWTEAKVTMKVRGKASEKFRKHWRFCSQEWAKQAIKPSLETKWKISFDLAYTINAKPNECKAMHYEQSFVRI